MEVSREFQRQLRAADPRLEAERAPRGIRGIELFLRRGSRRTWIGRIPPEAQHQGTVKAILRANAHNEAAYRRACEEDARIKSEAERDAKRKLDDATAQDVADMVDHNSARTFMRGPKPGDGFFDDARKAYEKLGGE